MQETPCRPRAELPKTQPAAAALSAYERDALDTVHQAMVYVRMYIREGRIATEDKARIHDLADVLHNVPLIVAKGRTDREREYVDSCLTRARMLMAV